MTNLERLLAAIVFDENPGAVTESMVEFLHAHEDLSMFREKILEAGTRGLKS